MGCERTSGIEVMTLCHGSNVEVREAKILKPKRGLDFGVVFYTTTNHDQAVAFTKHVTRNRGTGSATVSVYEIDKVKRTGAITCPEEAF